MNIWATVFDTETSGFQKNGLCQLAAVHVDHDCNIVNTFSFLVRPQGFDEIEEGAAAITGHTMERCEASGMDLHTALVILKRMCEQGDLVVCHNTGYDIDRAIAAACATLEKENFLTRLTSFCTMKALTDVCKIPGPRGYKWPKLQEAHKHCFGSNFDDAHDALADVHATVRVLKWIKENHPDKIPRA